MCEDPAGINKDNLNSKRGSKELSPAEREKTRARAEVTRAFDDISDIDLESSSDSDTDTAIAVSSEKQGTYLTKAISDQLNTIQFDEDEQSSTQPSTSSQASRAIARPVLRRESSKVKAKENVVDTTNFSPSNSNKIKVIMAEYSAVPVNAWEAPKSNELEFFLCDGNYPNRVVNRAELDEIKKILEEMLPEEVSLDQKSSIVLKAGLIHVVCSSELMAEMIMTVVNDLGNSIFESLDLDLRYVKTSFPLLRPVIRLTSGDAALNSYESFIAFINKSENLNVDTSSWRFLESLYSKEGVKFLVLADDDIARRLIESPIRFRVGMCSIKPSLIDIPINYKEEWMAKKRKAVEDLKQAKKQSLMERAKLALAKKKEDERLATAIVAMVTNENETVD
jgi:Domain of unknown function (DUF4780)